MVIYFIFQFHVIILTCSYLTIAFITFGIRCFCCSYQKHGRSFLPNVSPSKHKLNNAAQRGCDAYTTCARVAPTACWPPTCKKGATALMATPSFTYFILYFHSCLRFSFQRDFLNDKQDVIFNLLDLLKGNEMHLYYAPSIKYKEDSTKIDKPYEWNRITIV